MATYKELWKRAASADEKMALLVEHRGERPHGDALVLAAHDGDEDMVHHLLTWEESDAAQSASALKFALVYACRLGLENMVWLLLEAGANPKWDRNAGIKLACHNGHIGVVRLMLEAGAYPSYADTNILPPCEITMFSPVIKALLDEYK